MEDRAQYQDNPGLTRATLHVRIDEINVVLAKIREATQDDEATLCYDDTTLEIVRMLKARREELREGLAA